MQNYLFTRGTGPFVSVLLPTRKHPKELCEAIDSLHSLAHNPNDIEYLLWIDDDDDATLKIFDRMKGLINVRAHVAPRVGYRNMHVMVNALAARAGGDWLLLFNDDAKIRTEKWDFVLANSCIEGITPWHGDVDVCLYICQSIGRHDALEFAFLRRATFEILGHYSLNCHCDSWIANVTAGASSAFHIPINILHTNGEDEVRKQVLEDYKVAGRELNSVAMLRAKNKDVLALINHVSAFQDANPNWCLADVR